MKLTDLEADGMKNILVLGVLVFVLVIAVMAWRSAMEHRATRPDPAVMEPDIDVIMDKHAEDAVKEAQEKYSVALDYSPGSVAKVDAILGTLHTQYVKKFLDDKTLGRQSRLWGAYLGSVTKRVHPAKWEVDSEVAGKGALPLVFGPRDQTFPCAWTSKRIVNGDEDNIIFKYQILITQRGKPKEGLTMPRNNR
jgi:hypothetical protein